MATIFHITTAEQWQDAQAAGSYTGSTRGATLAEVGFVHCSRGDQWPKVRDALYADATEPLVLLKIDTGLLDVPVLEEPGSPDSEETFPHVYGPLPVSAVAKVIPLEDSRGPATGTTATTTRPSEDAFGSIFLKEVFRNAVVLFVLCANVMGGAIIGHAIRDDGYGAVAGLVVGALIGVPLAMVAKKYVSPQE
jgi:uncharacterized protein (DUF952 family)